MGRFKQVTTQVTYQVPTWFHCNCMSMKKPGQPTDEFCRFCIKEKNMYRCALYNMRLGTEDGVLVTKTEACKRASAGFGSLVEDVQDTEDITVSPKVLVTEAINTYIRIRKQLVREGYPAAMVDKLAKDFMLKEE